MGEIMNTYRLIPVDPYNITAVENWLSGMSEKGLSLVRIGRFAAVFKKSQECPANYRLLPFAGETLAKEDPSATPVIPDGWDYVTDKKNYFKIYRCSNPDAREPEYNPVQTAAVYSAASRRAGTISACLAVAGIALVAVLAAGFFLSNWPFIFAAEGGFTTQLLVGLLYLAAGLPYIQEAAGLRRLQKQLMENVSRSDALKHRSRPFRHGTGLLRLIIPTVSLLSLILAGRIGFLSLSRQLRDGIPASVSSLLSSANEWFLAMEGTNESGETTVSYGSSPFADTFCQISLTVSVSGRTWQESNLEYSPSFQLRYYDLSVSFLADPLFNELIERYTLQANITGRLTSQELYSDQFDRIVLADDGADTTCLFGLTEDRVIMVLYYGEAEPEQYLNKLYDLATSTP